MGYSSSSCLAGLVVLALISCNGVATAAEAVSCSQALQYLMPCQPFLMGVGEISSPCCLGAEALARATTSQADRKSVCQCLKQAALSINIDQAKAMQLPQLCNIQVPVPIRTDVNCDAIPMEDVRVKLNRYKNSEIKAFRPTTPGHSPGIGHGAPSPSD